MIHNEVCLLLVAIGNERQQSGDRLLMDSASGQRTADVHHLRSVFGARCCNQPVLSNLPSAADQHLNVSTKIPLLSRESLSSAVRQKHVRMGLAATLLLISRVTHDSGSRE